MNSDILKENDSFSNNYCVLISDDTYFNEDTKVEEFRVSIYRLSDEEGDKSLLDEDFDVLDTAYSRNLVDCFYDKDEDILFNKAYEIAEKMKLNTICSIYSSGYYEWIIEPKF